MGTTDAYDVVVVGAGIVGCMAARELAPDHDVLVLDRGRIAGEATGKASGLVTIAVEYADVPGAPEHALSFFRELDGAREFEWTERTYVELRSDEHDPGALRDRAARRREDGFDVEFLTPAGLEGRFPDTFDLDGHAGGMVYGDAGWLDPYTYAMTVTHQAEAEGAEFRTGVEVESVRVEGGAVGGVETTEGTVDAEHVVCAAGWRTRELLAGHVEVPLRPYRYQTYNLDPGRDVREFPMAWDEHTHLYWRPEHNGELHVGGGTYFVNDAGDVRSSTTEGFRRLVAATIPERLRGCEDARFIGGDTCPTGDAATPDRYPVIDAPAGAPDGLVVAAGMHGFGIMASPVAGTAIRSIVTGEGAPFPLEPFALSRFEDRSQSFGSSYISESPGAIGP